MTREPRRADRTIFSNLTEAAQRTVGAATTTAIDVPCFTCRRECLYDADYRSPVTARRGCVQYRTFASSMGFNIAVVKNLRLFRTIR